MQNPLLAKFWSLLKLALVLVPWVLSMYALYWLDASGMWSRDTPHRGKMSVILLVSGMLSSFIAYTYVAGLRRRR